MKQLSDAPLKGRLLALPTNIRLGWKGLPEINALAYYEKSSLTAVKSYIGLRSTEMVKGMKTVKMSCTESKMLDAVDADRSEELKFLRVDSVCWSAMTFLASVSTILMASVMVAAHSGKEVVQLTKMFNK